MGTSTRLQILLAEPNAEARLLLGPFLETAGFRVVELDSLEGLAEALNSERPQILLLALPPQARHAERLLASVRNYDRDLTIIALAEEPSVESAVAAMKYRAFEYLSHPLDQEGLRAVLDAAIEEKGLLVSLEQRLNREIGQQVRSRRSQTGLTLRQVANRTGLSVSLISQVELGKSAASVSTLYKLSRALHVKMGHFFEVV
jgi:DNA-binding NtrC family response regulator